MKIFPSRLFILTGLFVLGQLSIFAQNNGATGIPSGRVLEVDLQADKTPQTIALATGTPFGFWTSNIDRIKGWTLPEGAEPIQVVNFQVQLVGEKAELKVSVFSGSRFREKDDLIATYALTVGEFVIVKELAKYGVVPPKIRLVVVEPTIADVPLVVNETRSLTIEAAPAIGTLAIFVSKATNNSKKPVVEFAWHTMSGLKKLGAGIENDRYARPIILPGGFYEHRVGADGRETTAGTFSFSVDAVLFADGSYEGDLKAAANIKAAWYGKRDSLSRIIPILKAAVDAARARPNPPDLIARIQSDKREVLFETLEAFSREFPKDGNFPTQADPRFKAGRQIVLNEVIGGLRNLEKASLGRTDEEVNKALGTLTKYFEEWLDRISK